MGWEWRIFFPIGEGTGEGATGADAAASANWHVSFGPASGTGGGGGDAAGDESKAAAADAATGAPSGDLADLDSVMSTWQSEGVMSGFGAWSTPREDVYFVYHDGCGIKVRGRKRLEFKVRAPCARAVVVQHLAAY